MNKVTVMEGTRERPLPFIRCVARRRSQKKGIRHAVSKENHRAFFQFPCGFRIVTGRG